MSKDIDRDEVLQNLRVRKPRKNDGSWIHRSKDDNTAPQVEGKPAPVRQKSNVLLKAKIFESMDASPSSSPQKVQSVPSDSDSTNEKNSELNPASNNVQPGGSEITGDIKPQAPTEELIQNCDSPPEKAVAEVEEDYVNAPVDKSNVEHSEGIADVQHEEYKQQECSANETPEAVSSVEAEKTPTNTTAGDNEGQTDEPNDPSVIDANVENHVEGEEHMLQECSANETPEALLSVEAEQTPTNTTAGDIEGQTDEPNDPSVIDANVKNHVEGEEHMLQECSANETPEALLSVEAEQTPTNTTSGDNEGHEPNDPSNTDTNVENHISEVAVVGGSEDSTGSAEVPATPVAELKLQEESLINTEPENVTALEDAGGEISAQPTGESLDNIPTQQAKEEIMAAAAEVVADSLPDTSDVTNAAPGEDASLQESVPSVPDPLLESVYKPPSQFATENPTDGSCDTCPPGQDVKKTAESAAEVGALPGTPALDNATQGEDAASQNNVQPVSHPLPESLNHSAAETTTEGSNDLSPSEQDAKEIVEAIAEAEVESLPGTPAADEATLADEAALPTSVQPVPDNLSESPAAESAVRSVECEVESACPAEPVLKSRNEEVVESVDNTVVEQSIKPTPEEDAADHMLELNIEDAVKPVPATDAEAVSDNLVDRVIDLSDALDVDAPTPEAVPNAVEDPEQSSSEEPGLKQHDDDTNISEVPQQPAETPNSTQIVNNLRTDKAACSFCNQIIDGNTKLMLSEPQVICHPECLKCGVCSKALGDLLTPMYLHDKLIHCGDCFKNAP